MLGQPAPTSAASSSSVYMPASLEGDVCRMVEIVMLDAPLRFPWWSRQSGHRSAATSHQTWMIIRSCRGDCQGHAGQRPTLKDGSVFRRLTSIVCTDEVTVPVFRGLCHIWPLTVTDGVSLKSGTIEGLLVHRYRLAVFRRCRRRHIDSLFLHQAAGRSLPPAKGQTRPWARKSQPSSGCEKYSVHRSSRAQAKENFLFK